MFLSIIEEQHTGISSPNTQTRINRFIPNEAAIFDCTEAESVYEKKHAHLECNKAIACLKFSHLNFRSCSLPLQETVLYTTGRDFDTTDLTL